MKRMTASYAEALVRLLEGMLASDLSLVGVITARISRMPQPSSRAPSISVGVGSQLPDCISRMTRD
jgi:hypothetical protein